MTGLLLALGLIAVAALPLAFSHPAGLSRVRDWWLRGIACGAILLAPPFLAPIAAWWAWRWPALTAAAGPSDRAYGAVLGPLIVWTGIAMSWGLIARLEPSWWPWIAHGWVAVSAGQCLLLIRGAWRQGWRGFGRRQVGLYGSSVMSALGLALAAPFWPWWGWPLLAMGLWLTCSWAAFVALGAGAAIYWWPQ